MSCGRAGGLALRACAGSVGPGFRRGGAAGRRRPAGRQAEGAAQAGDQRLDRQGPVGEVDVDALVLGQLFPQIDGQPLPGIGIGSRGDDLGDALGDGLAPVVLLFLPALPPVLGLAPRLLPLLAQLDLQCDGAADAEEEAAEAGLRIPAAVEIAGLEGGDAQGLETTGQFLRERHQLGQHRGRIHRRSGFLLLPAQPGLKRDDAADGEEKGAEAALGLAGPAEIAGREGGESLSLEGPGHLQGEPGQPGQHLGLPGSLFRGRRSGVWSLGCGGIDHAALEQNRNMRSRSNCIPVIRHEPDEASYGHTATPPWRRLAPPGNSRLRARRQLAKADSKVARPEAEAELSI